MPDSNHVREYGPADLAVVIPTRDRWDILQRTLDSLRTQTASGFETVVVVDGTDQKPPDLPGVKVIVKEHGGPGAARNAGVAATDRALVLFLGDDMIPEPDLIAHHVDRHRASPESQTAVLGHAGWHPEAGSGPIHKWMDRSSTQFDYQNITTEDAGWGRFYSCNVSLKRSLFVEAGGFDEDFVYYYEDLDFAYRLHENGMRLLYEPRAHTLHLHAYDLASLKRRFEGIARGEWLMARKHPWFTPFFAERIRAAASKPSASRIWPRIVDSIPASLASLRRRAEVRADIWYHQRLADGFLSAWDGQRDLEELKSYLGPAYDETLLRTHVAVVEKEFEAAGSDEAFYRTSQMYLYDLTAFAMTGTKRPYLALLRSLLPRGSRVLDWGCGVGSDGLRLIDAGYDVSFADFDSPSTRYLRWRLDQRDLRAPVYDIEVDEVPSGFDAIYAFDVIEHIEDPFAFLTEMERHAALVMVNLLEEDPNDTHLHHHLPIRDLLAHAQKRGIVHYQVFHGRSHMIAYRTTGVSATDRILGALRRRTGRLLR
jgi:GT2 family glycosyltransferase/SAM-dependent methyltransferase